jgi:hypothetical protein
MVQRSVCAMRYGMEGAPNDNSERPAKRPNHWHRERIRLPKGAVSQNGCSIDERCRVSRFQQVSILLPFLGGGWPGVTSLPVQLSFFCAAGDGRDSWQQRSRALLLCDERTVGKLQLWEHSSVQHGACRGWRRSIVGARMVAATVIVAQSTPASGM